MSAFGRCRIRALVDRQVLLIYQPLQHVDSTDLGGHVDDAVIQLGATRTKKLEHFKVACRDGIAARAALDRASLSESMYSMTGR
jgi:hypothetical protein